MIFMSVKEHNGCKFIKAWIGTCEKETINGTDYCKEHEGIKCLCGHQATYDCAETVGAFVCGMYLCPRCEKNHMSPHWGFSSFTK